MCDDVPLRREMAEEVHGAEGTVQFYIGIIVGAIGLVSIKEDSNQDSNTYNNTYHNDHNNIHQSSPL
jgi:hypothetical protein